MLMKTGRSRAGGDTAGTLARVFDAKVRDYRKGAACVDAISVGSPA
jgi:hypothetical protein